MISSTKTLLQKAHKNHYAVGAFNISNLEFLQAVAQAAQEKKSPALIQTSESAIHYAGLKNLVSLFQNIARKTKAPLALHLDHGQDFNLIKQAILSGYQSVMIDASHKPFDQNIHLTKKIVQLAHKHKVSVEAELGTIGGAEETIKAKKIIYTDPLLAKEFVHKTKCDFLAVAIGTSHGAYKFKGKPHLNFSLLKQIRSLVKIPLVLHGASAVPKNLLHQAQKYGAQFEKAQGLPNSQLKKAIKLGINKVNIDTDLRLAFTSALRKFLKTHPRSFNPREILKPEIQAIKTLVKHKIDILGSKNKA